MESIYYVMTFLCHRQCAHCYEDRFRPYYGDELERVVSQSRSNFQGIIGNFPERMTYLDIEDELQEKPGRIILAGARSSLTRFEGRYSIPHSNSFTKSIAIRVAFISWSRLRAMC